METAGYRIGKASWTILLLVVIIMLLPVSRGFGQVIVRDTLTESKLHYLKSTLKTDYKRTQRWWYGWLGVYSAATIGQGAVFFTSKDKPLRQDMALGAITTLLGAAGQFISPFQPNSEYKMFNSIPESSGDEKSAKIIEAEKLLKQWSERERLALTWQNHILSLAVNVGGGLVTWLAFEDQYGKQRTVLDGLVNFAINTVVTEAQIWSQPTYAKRKYKSYCKKYLSGDEPYAYVPEINWYIEAFPGGLGLKVTF